MEVRHLLSQLCFSSAIRVTCLQKMIGVRFAYDKLAAVPSTATNEFEFLKAFPMQVSKSGNASNVAWLRERLPHTCSLGNILSRFVVSLVRLKCRGCLVCLVLHSTSQYHSLCNKASPSSEIFAPSF